MRALIIEDEKHLNDGIAEILKKNNFAVDSAYDGEEGEDLALSGVYDVVLLDIMLPKKNGVEVLKTLRKEKIATPVLLLTALSEISDKVKGLDAGADDYLTKPFDSSELIARIRALTRRKGEVAQDELVFGDVKFNTKTCELVGDTEKVSLGFKEFQLMELLMINSNQIITKEYIIDKLWGIDGDAEYNNVEVYISFLRKKLGLVSGKVMIKTARGIGYILELVK